MNKISSVKKALLQVAFVSSTLLIASCLNNPKPEDTKVVAEEHNEAKFDNNRQEEDAQFLVNAAEINMEEIQLGQLAQQVGITTHVKELGKMMEEAHTKLLSDLTVLAKNKMMTLPTLPTDRAKDTYKTLKEKAANDFDKAYADIMVSGHQNAITAFEKASTDCNDTDIKNWATATLPALRTHLDHSIECQKKCDKM